MFKSITILFLLSSFSLAAQTDPQCNTCACLWEKAENARQNLQFKTAITLYNAFVVCEPGAKTKATERILAIYQSAEDQKDLAKKAEKEATLAQKRAEKAQATAETAKIFNQNISTTLLRSRQDPTLALAMASYLYQQAPDQSAASAVLGQIMSDEIEGVYYQSFSGHDKALNSVVFFNDNQRLATASSDSTLRIWNIKGQLIQKISFPYAVKTIAISAQNLLAVALERDSNRFKIAAGIELLDENGSRKGHFSQGSKTIKALCFSPDGQFLTAGAGQTLSTWNLIDQHQTSWSLPGDKTVIDLKYAPDGQSIWVGAKNGQSDDMWYQFRVNGTIQDSLTIQNLAANALDISADGQLLMSGGEDNDAMAWLLPSKEPVLYFQGHKGDVTDVGISPQGNVFATSSQDGSLFLYGQDGQIIRKLHGHDRQVNVLAFSPDGQWLASAGSDKTLKVWRVYSAKPLIFSTVSGGEVLNMGFLPGTQRFYTAQENSAIHFWNVDGTLTRMLTDRNEVLQATALAPSGKWLLSGGSEGWTTLWDTTGNQQLSIAQPNESVIGLGFFNGEKNICTAAFSGSIKVWDLKGDPLRTIKSATGQVHGFASAPNGQYFAVYANDDQGQAQLALYETNGQLVKLLKYPNLNFTSIAFSADSKTLYAGDFGGELLRWNWKESQPVLENVADFKIFSLSPVPEQNWMLTGTGDQVLGIRNRYGEIIRTFAENKGWVLAAAASSDGEYLVCANQFGQILVRDLTELQRWARSFSVEELQKKGGLILVKK